MIINYRKKDIILPDFLIIGAAKSGTSSLNYWLDSYDEIFMPDPKEPNFFSFENFQQTYQEKLELHKATNLHNFNFNEYQQLFKEKENKIIGDASTGYIRYPDNVISNIEEYYGDHAKNLKLICLLRNPVDKIYSHYLMFVKWGVESREFRETIIPKYKTHNNIIEQQIDYLAPGFYYEDLKKYKEYFGSNLKVYLFDDLIKNKEEVLRDVLNHIGLKTEKLPNNINQVFNEGGIPKNNFAKMLIAYRGKERKLKNFLKSVLPSALTENIKKKVDNLNSTLTYKPKIDKTSKMYLQELYKNDIIKTSKLIDRDLSSWLS